MALPAPRHLDRADQAFSNRAADAASAASIEQRSHAWQIVAALRGRLAEPGDGELEHRLETACLYGAAVLLIHEGDPLADAEVVRVAERAEAG